MTEDLEIKNSKIDGRGVFAMRSFKKGEIVLKWKPVLLMESEFQQISNTEKPFVAQIGKKFYRLLDPIRHVNHSCAPNTQPLKLGVDIAVRNIGKGEEITSDYLQKIRTVGRCNCGSTQCAGLIAYF